MTPGARGRPRRLRIRSTLLSHCDQITTVIATRGHRRGAERHADRVLGNSGYRPVSIVAPVICRKNLRKSAASGWQASSSRIRQVMART